MTNINVVYETDIELFQKGILTWFSKYGRDFPWRKASATNYELIIAEIFLQRTKAETVANFLSIFLKQYPNWNRLFQAKEEEIQNFIMPLGLYKQRGTRLFKLAQELKKRNGEFPKERNQVEEMSMMGQYLTNAYELYILKKKAPLLDVNMARLLERFFGKRKLSDIRYDPYLQTLAYRVVNIPDSKKLNWAILDFATLICKTKNPMCTECCISENCNSFILKLTNSL